MEHIPGQSVIRENPETKAERVGIMNKDCFAIGPNKNLHSLGYDCRTMKIRSRSRSRSKNVPTIELFVL